MDDTRAPRLDQAAGLCATCRRIESRLAPYTARPWWTAFECSVRGSPMAPAATFCDRYEREPGSDDE